MSRMRLAGVLALAAMMFAGVTAAPASAETQLEYVQGVAARLSAGTATSSDMTFLNANPDLKAGLVDGKQSELSNTVVTPVAQVAATDNYNAVSSYAKRCYTAQRSFLAKSGTGGVLYRYNMTLDWCENGSSIQSSSFTDYFTQIAMTMENESPGKIHTYKKPSANHWVAYEGGSIQNCILKWGCIGTKHPAMQLAHYANRGNVTYMWYNLDDTRGWRHQ